jgi:hypothetical protein
VETTISIIKRLHGSATTGRSYHTRRRDMMLMVLTHNIMIVSPIAVIVIQIKVFYRADLSPLLIPFHGFEEDHADQHELSVVRQDAGRSWFCRRQDGKVPFMQPGDDRARPRIGPESVQRHAASTRHARSARGAGNRFAGVASGRFRASAADVGRFRHGLAR